jgi:hypothetical protein
LNDVSAKTAASEATVVIAADFSDANMTMNKSIMNGENSPQIVNPQIVSN